MAKIPKRSENYSQWYNELVIKAGLAEYSTVRGCMIIKPYGYSIWEKIRDELDRRFKETGHQNAYFPIFIPKSFFSKEAKHVEGFAKEAAVVTHYRLKNAPDGSGVIVDPEAKLDEEYIVRPTSETIIWDAYKRWIQSYRDLPILINQWANVVRWEMRTRLFLRTAEFLWQEGHTAHETEEEAFKEARMMIDLYKDFVENFLAIPIIHGYKTPSERFAGAVETFTIEAMMQDGKALQAGTSHFLGQNFAKAFDVKFLNREGKQEYVWATSWGVSTRLIGALIMAHSDDNGLVLPPKVAPLHVVIVPIYKSLEQLEKIRQYVQPIIKALKEHNITVKFDDDDKRKPGWKFAEYELRGVPVRISVGNKEMENNQVEIARRDTLEKALYPIDNIHEIIGKLLQEIQKNLFEKALKFREEHTYYVDTWDEFKEKIKQGFVFAHWDGTAETEAKIKELTKATIRVIPFDAPEEQGKDVLTGKPSNRRVLFARAY